MRTFSALVTTFELEQRFLQRLCQHGAHISLEAVEVTIANETQSRSRAFQQLSQLLVAVVNLAKGDLHQPTRSWLFLMVIRQLDAIAHTHGALNKCSNKTSCSVFSPKQQPAENAVKASNTLAIDVCGAWCRPLVMDLLMQQSSLYWHCEHVIATCVT